MSFSIQMDSVISERIAQGASHRWYRGIFLIHASKRRGYCGWIWRWLERHVLAWTPT